MTEKMHSPLRNHIQARRRERYRDQAGSGIRSRRNIVKKPSALKNTVRSGGNDVNIIQRTD